MSAVLASVYVPMAVKLAISPFATEALFGLIEIAVNAASVTVNVALFDAKPLAEALTVVVPLVLEVKTPLPFIVATAVLVDVQITDPEASDELPSE